MMSGWAATDVREMHIEWQLRVYGLIIKILGSQAIAAACRFFEHVILSALAVGQNLLEF